jgi:hypothetical protein
METVLRRALERHGTAASLRAALPLGLGLLAVISLIHVLGCGSELLEGGLGAALGTAAVVHGRRL